MITLITSWRLKLRLKYKCTKFVSQYRTDVTMVKQVSFTNAKKVNFLFSAQNWYKVIFFLEMIKEWILFVCLYAWLCSRLKEQRLVETIDTQLICNWMWQRAFSYMTFGTQNCYETIVMPVPWRPSIMAGERNFFWARVAMTRPHKVRTHWFVFASRIKSRRTRSPPCSISIGQ